MSNELCFEKVLRGNCLYLFLHFWGHSITTWIKKGGEVISRKSMLGDVTKGRYHVKCSQLSTRGGRAGVKIE